MEKNDSYKYDGIDVIKYIVAYANKGGFDIDNVKLQKLMYIVYGLYLASTNKKLIEELPLAMEKGPVFKTVDVFLKSLNNEYSKIGFKDVKDELKTDDELCEAISVAFRYFGKIETKKLVDWTHKEGSPWFLTDKKDFISDKLIQKSFMKFYKR